MAMEAFYEIVYVVEEWYDGPRSGYADYKQKPYFYRSIFLDIENDDDYNPNEDRFEMTPVSEQVVEWAVAKHGLWLRWNAVYRTGALSQEVDDVRILPEDRVHYQELCVLVEQCMITQREISFIVRGKFELGSRRVQWNEVKS